MAALTGQVAAVAGATRGAGRGIARMLGEAGATAYCTGRSSRERPRTHTHHYRDRPETIEETADLVTEAGGAGIPMVVEHAEEARCGPCSPPSGGSTGGSTSSSTCSRTRR